jgi:sugar lactone lactonase YvrE
MQVTGITVTEDGRMFVNFPKWRQNIPFSVVEVTKDNNNLPYPNKDMNSWKIGDPIVDDKFISVQSVVAKDQKLYVLDTANPLFKGIITSPRIYVFDLTTNKLVKSYTIPSESPNSVVETNSYVNDLVIDDKNNKMYMTDSGVAGIIILDLKTETFKRVLNNHKYTLAEKDQLTINGKPFMFTVHSDGIAFDPKKNILYIHALTGYTLYGIKTSELEKKNPKTQIVLKTSAPDGMVVDKNGNLYFADLENHQIKYLKNDGKTIVTLAKNQGISWADSFSINKCSLYFTDSRIHEVMGLEDISKFEFNINKVALPNCK